MNRSIKLKLQVAFGALAVLLFCCPTFVAAGPPVQKKGGYSKSSKSGSSGRSYGGGKSYGSSKSYGGGQNYSRGSSYSGQRGGTQKHYGGSKYGSGYNRYSNSRSHYRPYNRSYYGSNRNYFSLSPYGFGYGNYGRGSSFYLSIPFGGYSSYYRPYRTYDYGVYRGYPYATPAYDYPGSYYYGAQAYSVPEQIAPNVIVDSTIIPSTQSTMKPATDYDSRAVNRNQITVIPTANLAEPTQRRAEMAFRSGQYIESVRLANEALAIDPENGQLMLFAAQANFAVGNYGQAISSIAAATDRLSPERWNFVVKNFRQLYGRDDYVSQMNQLSAFIEGNPTHASALVLRGYQYGGLDFPEAAAKDFQAALDIKPDDALATKLLPVLGGFETEIPIQPPMIEQPQPPQLKK